MQVKPGMGMQSFVVHLLKERLAPFYYYHNHEHTLYVEEKAVEIGRHEGCDEAEMRLLRAAALWHDTGFINTDTQHEEASCILARHYLPQFDFSATDINSVCGMIMATQLPQSPKNKLEAIIADADLAYLGTEIAAAQAEQLFRELQHRHPMLTASKWNKTQLVFLQMHRYFTLFCKNWVEPGKQAYLQQLRNATMPG